ncbi:MAG: winged helix-turn-helix transcriptional regulator [Candidatus Helarchaeota archaeon]|nr:winged helix-turn-helix transcriptional regulator [Candidatus Helarchaeota archaeon]
MSPKSEDPQLKILNLLEEEDLGLSITQIAEKIGLNRNSTAKYLEIMAEKEIIYKREQGPTSKLFYPVRRSKSFEARADYMVRFYQLLHSALFYDFLQNPKKARDIGLEMAKKGAAALYIKQFENVELNFETIIHFIGIATEITYPTPHVKAKVHRSSGEKDKFILELKNCICDGVKEYKSICEIQVGLFKGVIEEMISPQKVHVQEIECRVDGFESCKYLITKLAEIEN